ncbi:MAG: histidinol dehydrogenase, partial [Xanthomonadales bacterium]|nr:histidinol dehydrogenase [Xanthomonadales bacterium]
QAEHGPDSQVLLVSDDPALLDAVERALTAQLPQLPRAEVASAALAHSRAVLVDSIEAGIELSNRYAPEHLILQLERPRQWLARVRNAGSVFLGALTPESLGDYGSGTNHVLPTGGAARYTGGVSVDSFQKQMTVQQADVQALREVGPQIIRLAQAEGLDAHALAVSRRLDWLAQAPNP